MKSNDDFISHPVNLTRITKHKINYVDRSNSVITPATVSVKLKCLIFDMDC